MHSLAAYFRHLFQYERDSDKKVVAALRAVPESARASELYQMAVDIMGHVIAARGIWLWRMGAAATRPDTNFPKGMSLPDLEQDLKTMHEAWSDYLARLDEAELARTLEYTTLDGRPFHNRVEEILTQLHGHALYHRGQISTWLRQAGASPAPTDYILRVREQPPGAPHHA